MRSYGITVFEPTYHDVKFEYCRVRNDGSLERIDTPTPAPDVEKNASESVYEMHHYTMVYRLPPNEGDAEWCLRIYMLEFRAFLSTLLEREDSMKPLFVIIRYSTIVRVEGTLRLEIRLSVLEEKDFGLSRQKMYE